MAKLIEVRSEHDEEYGGTFAYGYFDAVPTQGELTDAEKEKVRRGLEVDTSEETEDALGFQVVDALETAADLTEVLQAFP